MTPKQLFAARDALVRQVAEIDIALKIARANKYQRQALPTMGQFRKETQNDPA